MTEMIGICGIDVLRNNRIASVTVFCNDLMIHMTVAMSYKHALYGIGIVDNEIVKLHGRSIGQAISQKELVIVLLQAVTQIDGKAALVTKQ